MTMAKDPKRIITASMSSSANAILHTIPAAVDQVCAETALQIEATAKNVLEDAALVSQKLNELALAVREHGRRATEHVALYCTRTKHTMEAVARLQDNLINGGAEEHTTIEGTAELPKAPQLADAG